MRIKLVALAFGVLLGHLHACTGEEEQVEVVQEDAAVGDATDEITPESQDVADAELTTPDDEEKRPAGNSEAQASDEPDYSDTDESMAMYSEPPLPSDDGDDDSDSADVDEAAPAAAGKVEAQEAKKPDSQNTEAPADTAALASEQNADASENAVTAAVEPKDAPKPVESNVDATPSYAQSPGAKWQPTHSGPQKNQMLDKIGTYTVRPGDTLGGIAVKLYRNFNRYRDLAEANGLAEPYRLYPGQTLSYSGSVPADGSSTPDKTLIVRAGDTLWHLASKHLGSPYVWQAFVKWNPSLLSDPNRIAPGMKLAYGAVDSSLAASVTQTTTPKRNDAAVGKIDVNNQPVVKSDDAKAANNAQKSVKTSTPSALGDSENWDKDANNAEVKQPKKAVSQPVDEPADIPENSFEEEEAE